MVVHKVTLAPEEIEELIYLEVLAQLPKDSSMDDLVKALREAGFFDVRQRPVSFTSSFQSTSKSHQN